MSHVEGSQPPPWLRAESDDDAAAVTPTTPASAPRAPSSSGTSATPPVTPSAQHAAPEPTPPAQRSWVRVDVDRADDSVSTDSLRPITSAPPMPEATPGRDPYMPNPAPAQYYPPNPGYPPPHAAVGGPWPPPPPPLPPWHSPGQYEQGQHEQGQHDAGQRQPPQLQQPQHQAPAHQSALQPQQAHLSPLAQTAPPREPAQPTPSGRESTDREPHLLRPGAIPPNQRMNFGYPAQPRTPEQASTPDDIPVADQHRPIAPPAEYRSATRPPAGRPEGPPPSEMPPPPPGWDGQQGCGPAGWDGRQGPAATGWDGQQGIAPPGWDGHQGLAPPPGLDPEQLVRTRGSMGARAWRRTVQVASGGLIKLGHNRSQQQVAEMVARIRQPIRGDFRLAVLSLKGGVGKTTTTVGLGSVFASLRGDRVIAVDANPDLGTLAGRVPQQTYSTVRTLLNDPQMTRYTDVRRHTSQSASRLEVLASERDPAVSEAFSEADYRRVLGILENFYNIIITDCGTGLMHSAMRGVLSMANAIVLVTSPAVDGAQSASATLDWLNAHGYQHLTSQAVVVISASKSGNAPIDMDMLTEHFLGRTRAVQIIPYDDHVATGSHLELEQMDERTRIAFLELAATVADSFTPPALPPPPDGGGMPWAGHPGPTPPWPPQPGPPGIPGHPGMPGQMSR